MVISGKIYHRTSFKLCFNDYVLDKSGQITTPHWLTPHHITEYTRLNLLIVNVGNNNSQLLDTHN